MDHQRLFAQGKSGWFLALLRSGLLAGLSGLVVTLGASPGKTAERIFLFVGPLQLSVQVNSLEAFAKSGQVNQDLALYLSRVNPEQQQLFRLALTKTSEVDPLQLARVFYTPTGQTILQQIGTIMTLPSGGNGQYALRAALLQAAFDPEGLNLLTLLQKFPTDVRLNPSQLLMVVKDVEALIGATQIIVDQVGGLAAQEAQAEALTISPNFAALPDLRQYGPQGSGHRTLRLRDEGRGRSLRLDLYQPQRWRPGKTPVVVLSHGLASNPEDFRKLAEYLNSYGYVVAAPQHPGSDYHRVQALLEGLSSDLFDLQEFLDRPRDISFVLDELERLNGSAFQGRLDLDRVGLLGHSFGGYTVLALAGATLDFEALQQVCDRTGYLNVSLLLQCRALELPQDSYDFRDRRVQAVIGTNPVNSSIFGPRGLGNIQIPTLIEAGSYDPATPAVYEQFRSFPWLQTPHKYLALVEGQAHVDFSLLDGEVTRLLGSFEHLTLPSPKLLDSYSNVLALAFFEVHLLQNPTYRPYLTASYGAYISEAPFNLYLLSRKSDAGLQRALDQVNLQRE